MEVIKENINENIDIIETTIKPSNDIIIPPVDIIETIKPSNEIPIIPPVDIIETIKPSNEIPIIPPEDIIETIIIPSNEIPIIPPVDVIETIKPSNDIIIPPVDIIETIKPSNEIPIKPSNDIIETIKIQIDTPMKPPIDVIETIKPSNDNNINKTKTIDKNIPIKPKTNNQSIFANYFNKKKNNNDIDSNKKEMINSPNEESPKIEANKDDIFIDIPNRSSSVTRDEISADFVNINMDSNHQDTYDEKADKILELIKDNKKKITNNLYIISCKYDIIYYRYNSISLSLLIISTIITFIEAIRLTIINYDTQFQGSEISKHISQDTISLIINCLSLSLSTILTILSSIARFKNYKENMDKLKVIHDTLFNYKNLYDKEKDLIHYYKINNELNYEIFKKIQDTIEDYNKEIKSINIFENIRNTDIIKFNNIKVNHDLRLHQLSSKREIELLRINKFTKKKKEEITNNNTIGCYGFN